MKHPEFLGATYISRKFADYTVNFLGDQGIVSEVIPDGRYFRVRVYLKPARSVRRGER